MKKLFLIFLFPSICFGAGTVSLNQGSGGGTVTIVGSSGSGGSTSPGGSNTNVQSQQSGAFYGDSGFQYDSSVSSVTLGGSLGIIKALAINDNGATRPSITLTDNTGSSPNANILDYFDFGLKKINLHRVTSGFDINSSTASNGSATTRIHFSDQNDGLTQFYNGNGVIFQFNNINSTFTIPVVLSTITFSDGSQFTTAHSTSALIFNFNGNGSVLTMGTTVVIQVPFNCVASSWTVGALAQSGSATFNIYRSTSMSFPNPVTNMSLGNNPTLTSAQYATGTTGAWNSTTVSAKEWVYCILTSVTSLTQAIVEVWVYK